MKAPLLLLFLVMLASSTIVAAEKSKKQPLTEEQIRQVLTRIVIPKVELQNTTLKEALDFLTAEIRRLNPHARQIPILLEIDPFVGPPAPREPIPPIPGLIDEPNPSDRDPRSNVSLHDIPAIELIRYITGLYNAEFHVRSDGVHIVELGDPGPMFTRTFRIPADFFPAFEREDRIFRTHQAANMKENFSAYIFPPGLLYPGGSTVILNSDATQLTVRTTAERLAVIQKLLETDRPASAFPIPGPDIPKVIEGLPREGVADWKNAETDTARKLRTIRLPKVDFQNVSPGRAGILLTKMSAQYDHDSHHTKRGVMIKMQGYPDSPLPPSFNYSATNVLLFDVVRAIAEICICVPVIDERGVEWKSGYTERSICTRTYFLPPSTVEQLARWSESTYQDIPVPWMQESGVTFLPHNGNEYIAKRHQLILTATRAAQQIAQQGNDNAWRDYYASQKTKTQKAD